MYSFSLEHLSEIVFEIFHLMIFQQKNYISVKSSNEKLYTLFFDFVFNFA